MIETDCQLGSEPSPNVPIGLNRPQDGINTEICNPDDGLLILPEARKVFNYLMRVFEEAGSQDQSDANVSPGVIALPDRKLSHTDDRRVPNSAPPMTIPQFKEWAIQTGVESLRVSDITLWKSQGIPLHEFIVVTLESFPTFKPEALPASGHPLELFDLEGNVQHGLKFRIDRGASGGNGNRFKIATGRPTAANDFVELMDRGSKLEGCDACFSLSISENHVSAHFPLSIPKNRSSLIDKLFSPRVFDIVFCLERTTEKLGPQYTVHELNCWSFATVFFRMICFLFKAVPRKLVTCPRTVDNFIRKRFLTIQTVQGQTLPYFYFDTLLGHPWLYDFHGVQWVQFEAAEMTDLKVIIQRNPFRIIFLWVVLGYVPILELEPEGSLANVSIDAILLGFSKGLSSVFIDSGAVTLLKTLIQRYLSNYSPGPMKASDSFTAWQTLATLHIFVEWHWPLLYPEGVDSEVATDDLECYVHFLGLCQSRLQLDVRLSLLQFTTHTFRPSNVIHGDTIKAILEIIIQTLSDDDSRDTSGQYYALTALMSIANIDEQLEVIRRKKRLESLFKAAFSRGLPRWPFTYFELLCHTVDKMKWSPVHLLFFKWNTIEIVMGFVARDRFKKLKGEKCRTMQNYGRFALDSFNLLHRMQSARGPDTRMKELQVNKYQSALFLMRVMGLWIKAEKTASMKSVPQQHSSEAEEGLAEPGGDESIDRETGINIHKPNSGIDEDVKLLEEVVDQAGGDREPSLINRGRKLRLASRRNPMADGGHTADAVKICKALPRQLKGISYS